MLNAARDPRSSTTALIRKLKPIFHRPAIWNELQSLSRTVNMLKQNVMSLSAASPSAPTPIVLNESVSADQTKRCREEETHSRSDSKKKKHSQVEELEEATTLLHMSRTG